MKKKRIFIVIIVLFFILVVGYLFFVNKNKLNLNQSGMISNNASVTLYSLNDLNKKTLLNFKIAVIPADLRNSEHIHIDGTSMEAFKKNSNGYDSIDSTEKIKISICDEDLNVVKEMEVDPKEDFSKWVILDKRKSYSIVADSNQFMGLYFINTCEYYVY